MTKRIAVLGAGPGGYVAAIRAAQLDAKVFLVEDDKVGGTCLNRGCIPTKAYFKNAEVVNTIKNSENFGVTVKDFSVDGNALQDRKNEIVGQLVSGIDQLISSYDNIEFLAGRAKIEDKNTINVKLHDGKEETIEVDYIIIATGSRPTMTEVEGFDLDGVITSDDLLEMREIPESLVVIGGGVIGLEFASIYQELGSEVTLLASRVLKDVDREIKNKLPREFEKRGMTVYKDIRAKKIVKEGDKLRVVAKFKNKDKEVEVLGEKILMASGRGPVVDGLNLEEVGVDYSLKDGVKVDDDYRTNIENIFAIGDVNSKGIQLAHVASAQGVYVVEKIMGLEPDINLEVFPDCVFTLPEVAFVGMKEEDLKESGLKYKESKFLFAANGKALTLGEGNGFIKVYASEDNKILGVTIMGPHANDLIHEGALAISNGMAVEDIARTIHAHPTLSEAFMEAVDGLNETAIHIAPKRKRKR